MKKIALIFSLISLSLHGAYAIDFATALQEKKIQVVGIETMERIDDKDLVATIKNISGKSLLLSFPVGTYFAPSDSSFQPRFLAEANELMLAVKTTKTVELKTVCGNAVKRSPYQKTSYNYQNTKGKLQELVHFLQKSTQLPIGEVQSAVWTVTNAHRVEAINDEALKAGLVKITGQEPKPLKMTYKHQNIPGEVAYREKELRVQGLFRYGTEKDIKAHLGIYDKNGKLVKTLRPNMLHQRGQHSFRFDFTIINVQPGDYFIRLTNGNAVLNEMAIAF